MEEDSKQNKIGRRSAMKMGIGAFAGVATVGSGTRLVSASEDDKGGQQPPDDPTANGPTPSVEFGTEFRKLNWAIAPLAGNKDQTLSYISAADVSTSQRDQARENVKDLWEQIEIKEQMRRVRDVTGTRKVTKYELATSPKKANEVLDDLENRGMEAQTTSTGQTSGTMSVINSGANMMAPGDSNEEATTQWAPTDSHHIMAYHAGRNLELTEYKCNYLMEASDDPDNWEYDTTGVPENFEEMWAEEPGRAWAHAYDNSVFYDGSDIRAGNADNKAKKYMEKSQNADNTTAKYNNMGYALHFLSDLGNPLHTDYLLTQASSPWVHHTYEGSVEDHLYFEEEHGDDDPKNYFINNVDFSRRDDLGPDDYYEVDDPEWYQLWNKWANHARKASNVSRNYAESAYLRTYNAGSDADIIVEVPSLREETEYCVTENMKYLMGYVEEYNSDVEY